MKHSRIAILLSVIAFTLWSCSKVVIWQPDDEEVALYSKIYIPQAEKKPVITLTMDDDMTEPYEGLFSVYLGGPRDASNDIAVQFASSASKVTEYNQKNNTNYQSLPADMYQLTPANVTIPNGERRSDNVVVKITPDEDLEVGTYLLAISISSDAAVNEKLNTVYFVVKVPKAKIPNVKVLTLGSNWGNILSNGPDGVLYRRDKDGVMWVYKPDSEGIYSTPPTRFPGDPWHASGWFYYIKDNIEMVVNDDGWYGMFRFDIEANTYLLNPKPTVNPSDPWPNNFGFWYGDGWNKFTLLPQKNHIFFVNKENGNLLRAPIDDFLDPYVGTWHKPGWVDDPNNVVGSGFKDYRQVMTFPNHLMAVKNDGTLWVYPISETGQVGAVKQIGTGWNQYVRFVTTGSYLLALDANGDLFRYEIDPNEVYDL